MKEHSLDQRTFTQHDCRLLYDMLSVCLDGVFANSRLHNRADNTLEKQVFQSLSVLYRHLAACLMVNINRQVVKVNAAGTNAASPTASIIATAYLAALDGSASQVPIQVMDVNKQTIRQLRAWSQQLVNEPFVCAISDNLASLQRGIDRAQQRRENAQL